MERTTYVPSPRLNRIPITHQPKRFIGYTSSASNLHLSNKQKSINRILFSANRKARNRTQKVLKSLTKLPQIPQPIQDSFLHKYKAKQHTFRHDLIGQINLPNPYFLIVPKQKQIETIRKIQPPKHYKQINLQIPTISYQQLPSHQIIHSDKLTRALTTLRHFSKLNLSSQEILQLKHLIPTQPHQLPRSRQFLNACKIGDLLTVRACIADNPWVLHSFDSGYQTGLHWAARRSHLQLMKFLLEKGLYVDCRDSANRTALMVSIKTGSIPEISLLLGYRASILKKSLSGHPVEAFTKNTVILSMLRKAKIVFYAKKFLALVSQQEHEITPDMIKSL